MMGISIFNSCNNRKVESPPISKTESNEIMMAKYIPANQNLYDTIDSLDKFLWEAYNKGNDSIIVSYVTEDFKLFHDEIGTVFSKKKFAPLVSNYFKKIKNLNFKGETVDGTNEVYEIPNYGAIQFSYQRFRDNENPEWTAPARMITVWKKTSEGWRQSQQFSFHE
tara:strand:- start:197 stop:694 length:498 start_codon:yes stop_codon:yes gene_type:complete